MSDDEDANVDSMSHEDNSFGKTKVGMPLINENAENELDVYPGVDDFDGNGLFYMTFFFWVEIICLILKRNTGYIIFEHKCFTANAYVKNYHSFGDLRSFDGNHM